MESCLEKIQIYQWINPDIFMWCHDNIYQNYQLLATFYIITVYLSDGWIFHDDISHDHAHTWYAKYDLCNCRKSLSVLANVACAYVEPASDNGVNRYGIGGWASSQIRTCQECLLSHVISGQNLQLVMGLYCRFTLTQHVLGMKNENEMSVRKLHEMHLHAKFSCKHKCKALQGSYNMKENE